MKIHRAALNSISEEWPSLTIRKKQINFGAKIVRHGRYVIFQMAEVAVSRLMFGQILSLIARLCAPPAPA